MAKEKKQDVAKTEGNEKNFIVTFFDNLFDFLETDRFTILLVVLYFLFLGMFRSYTESKWYDYHNYSFYLVAQHTMFNLPVFIIGVFLIALVMKVRPKKILNVVLMGFGIVALPPLLDRFVFGLYGPKYYYLYEYWSFQDLQQLIVKFFTFDWFTISEITSPGLWVMVAGLLIMTGAYVAFRMRSVIRGVLASISIAAVIGFISNLPRFLLYHIPKQTYSLTNPGSITLFSSFDIGLSYSHYEFVREAYPTYGQYYVPFLIEQQRSISIISYFLILSIIFCTLMAWYFYRDLFRHLVKKIDIWLMFIPIAAVVGVASVKSIDPTHELGLALDFTYLPHMAYIFLITLTVLFAWMYIVLDRELQYSAGKKRWHIEDVVTKYQYKEIRNAFGLMSLLLATLLGALSFSFVSWIPLLLVIAFMGVGTLVHDQQTKKKRKETDHRLSLKTAYPLLAAIAFIIGVFSPSTWLLMVPNITQDSIGTLVDTTNMSDMSIDRVPGFSVIMVAMLIIIIIISYYLSNIYRSKPEPDRKERGRKRR